MGRVLGRQRLLVEGTLGQGSCSGKSPVFLEIRQSMSVAKASVHNKIVNIKLKFKRFFYILFSKN